MTSPRRRRSFDQPFKNTHGCSTLPLRSSDFSRKLPVVTTVSPVNETAADFSRARRPARRSRLHAGDTSPSPLRRRRWSALRRPEPRHGDDQGLRSPPPSNTASMYIPALSSATGLYTSTRAMSVRVFLIDDVADEEQLASKNSPGYAWARSSTWEPAWTKARSFSLICRLAQRIDRSARW